MKKFTGNILSKDEFSRIRQSAIPLDEMQLADMWKDVYQHKMQHSASPVTVRPKTAASDRCKYDEEIDDETRKSARRRATQLQNEQQDEIRQLNTLIMEAKCLAAREEQVREKQKICREEQEKRLELERKVEAEQMRIEMEIEARKAKKKAETLVYAEEIKKQMEHQAKLKAEVKVKVKKWEAENLDKKISEYNLVKQKEKQKLIDLQNEFKKNLKISVEMKKHEKKEQEERERRRLEKIQTAIEMKDENEKLMKCQKAKQKLESELKKQVVVNKWLEQQQFVKNRQTKLESQRNETVEMLDREWRNIELKKVQQDIQAKKKLQDEWAQQIKQKNQTKELKKLEEMAKDRAIIRADEDKVAEDEKKKIKIRTEKIHQMQQFKQQMDERQKARKQFKTDILSDAIDCQNQLMERQQNLNEIRQQKLIELRSAKIPEKHVENVDRRSKKILSLKSS
ncbi:hypothetical protein CHUAL_012162 [Chamberlinius hualienensis]